MCGIAGMISFNSGKVTTLRLREMTDTIVHRGPEGEGFWVNESGHVGLGHRRLSILDLSDAGAQPMHYLNRYSISFNGEIYNYTELREALRKHGYTFHSQSDTEVILAAYDLYNTDCLNHFDGMFAFGIWDEKTKTLFCARDRFGEKPFYYYEDEGQFLFASEMKALWAAGAPKEMEASMLVKYLALGYTTDAVDNTATFYKRIHQLAPSTYLLIEAGSTGSINRSFLTSYWDIDKETVTTISEHEAHEQFASLLQSSVAGRLRSAVKVGTSLSGGLDSSSIAALVQLHLTPSGNTAMFSSVFPGFAQDESKYIELIASRSSIKNYTTTPAVEGFIDDLEALVYHHEEPFQSASMYAQYKTYELAKQHGVTVILDGQGADETLGGYHNYYHWYWQELLGKYHFNTFNKEIKSAKALGANAPWDVRNYIAAYLPGLTAKQLEKKAYRQLKLTGELTKDFVKSSVEEVRLSKPVVDKLNDILYFNTMQFGLQELLKSADRNSMAHSREVRLPFLSHELVQFIFSLPSNYKIRNGWTKWILRETMKQQLPGEIVWRKDKVGFEPPQQQWMEHPQLIERIQESKRKLVNNGILDKMVLTKPIRPRPANAGDNYDFRYLIAGLCLEPSRFITSMFM